MTAAAAAPGADAKADMAAAAPGADAQSDTAVAANDADTAAGADADAHPAQPAQPGQSARSTRSAQADQPAIHLRPAAPEDALCLSVLAMQVFLDTYCTEGIRPTVAREVLVTYSQAAFTAALADAGTRIVVAERAGHLVGFAQVTLGATHPLAPAGASAELLRLYVQEPFTGRQLGTALLAAAEQLARSAGATVLWLTPWVHNHRAIAFYRRRGYADHGLTWFEFEGERHENRVFARALPPG